MYMFKMHRAACGLKVVLKALEGKVGVTYRELSLTASGQVQEDDDPQDGIEGQEHQQSFKGAIKRYGKRCLAFIGAPDASMLLLTWVVVGQIIMKIHYKFFKHATWYSHAKPGTYRCSILDFCPDCPNETCPVFIALSELALLLFTPNGAGRSLLLPLFHCYGATLHWPEQLMRIFQRVAVRAFCRLWRELHHKFGAYPWRAAHIFHPEVDLEVRRTGAQTFWHAPRCQVDPWMGVPLLGELCQTVADLFEDDLQEFVHTLFQRCLATSTFVERVFAPMTRWTCTPRARFSLPSLGALHMLTVFDDQVQRWWGSLVANTDAIVPSGKHRDCTAYPQPKGGKTCGWQCYAEEKAYATQHSSLERFDAIKQTQQDTMCHLRGASCVIY